MKRVVVMLLLWLVCADVYAQADATQLYSKLRGKIDAIKDYVANVDMKIDVAFIRIPKLKGKLYFKAPDKMKLERNGGISILPKNSINMTVNNLLPGAAATVIDMGTEMLGTRKVRVLKVVPDTESDIILSKIWVDENRLLALKTETTTRDNGTIKMELDFGKYETLSLPDKVTFYLDVKEFKLPKGVTMDYETQPANTKADKPQKGNKKGKIQIHYIDYVVNKGIADNVFADKKK
jgi:outer membrane lipoprotein-sorting protein